jgi:hypothetical protein
MDILIDLIIALSKWTRLHLSDISLGIMTTALVLFGPAINAWVRRSISHLNFVIRTFIFILVCAVGYGLTIVYLTPLLSNAFAHLNNYTLSPVLLMSFILIGILADRN